MPSMTFLDPDKVVSGADRRRLEKIDKLIWSGKFAEAFDLTKDQPKSDTNPTTSAFEDLAVGDIFHFQWNFDKAIKTYIRARKGFSANNHQRGEIMTIYRLVDTYHDQGLSTKANSPDFKSRWKEFAAARSAASELGDRFLIAFGHHYQGLFNITAGRYKDAETDLRKAMDIRSEIKDVNYLESSRALLAVALVGQGQHDKAKQLAEQAFQQQMKLGLRGAAQRTLIIINLSEDGQFDAANNQLVTGFSSVGSRATTPFARAMMQLPVGFQRGTIEQAFAPMVIHS